MRMAVKTSEQIHAIPATVYFLALATLTSGMLADDGQRLYLQHCASCHGAKNEGVSEQFEHPISGPATLEELAAFIELSMPADDPGQIVGDDAKQVARFILRDFLSSEVAPAVPRIELVHLTVSQHENSVADILARFGGKSPVNTAGGLKGEYFLTREFWKGQPVVSRIDRSVSVDCGKASPVPEQLDRNNYSVVWKGSIFAPDSGDYVFSVRSPNGFKLHVNDDDVPLIDNWVSTPEDPDKTATIKLLGGRWYPFTLAAFRLNDPSFSIDLSWQRPGRMDGPVHSSFLSPEWSPKVFVVSTPFPADDSSVGYPRGTLVSREWDQATTSVGIEIGEMVVANSKQLVGSTPDKPDFANKCRRFCLTLAQAAFRRGLLEEEQNRYVDYFFEGDGSPLIALKRSVLSVFKSPAFLFPEIVQPDRREQLIANRLGLFLCDSVPENELAEKVKTVLGNSVPVDELTRVAWGLADSETGQAKLRQFFRAWLKIDDAQGLTRDPERFGGFDDRLVDDLQESLIRLVDEVVGSETSDYRQLFLADHLWMSPAMKEFYLGESGDDSPPGEEFAERSFERMQPDSGERAGLLTHPLVLSHLAYYRTTSPIHRGVFVSRGLLGLGLKPPPVAVEPLDEGFDPDMTTRQRVEFQTRPANCMSCHEVINPLGFAFENIDAVGRFRVTDNDKPVNASVTFKTPSGQELQLNGPRQLAEYLVTERAAHRHFVESLFHHVVKQPVAAYGENRLDELTDAFVSSGFNIRKLFVDIAVMAAVFEKMERQVVTE